MTDKIKIQPCLWFNKNAEEAAKFYAATFPNSHVTAVHKAPSDYPSGKAGDVLTVEFTVLGQPFMGLNGGPQFKFSEAFSMVVNCETQDEIDHYWEKLTADGGQESMCGWLKDKFGFSWQIIPSNIGNLMSDPERAQRVMPVLMQMKKLDMEKLNQA